MKQDTIALGIIAALLTTSLFLSTLPFQSNNLPFGDVDSSTHFTLADSMFQSDHTLIDLPAHFDNTYYLDANDGKLWYFPQYHTGAALFQSISDSRIIGAYLFFALMSSLIAIMNFVLIRSLFGIWIAGISSFWLLFSTREIMWYVLGVFPQIASFALIPIFLYCTHRYLSPEKEHDKKYLFLGAILAILQLFTHPQALLISATAASIYASLLFVMRRKTPFNIKHIGIAVIIAILLIVPFFQFIPKSETAGKVGFQAEKLNTLLSWYGNPESGMSPAYYSFSAVHHGWWIIPLLIVGIITLLHRRKPEDLLMLSWLAAFYISTHIGIFGLGRSLRFMQVEAHIFYPIAVLAIWRLPGLVKLDSTTRSMTRIGLCVVLIGIILFTAAPSAYSTLKDAYPGPLRITQHQYDATKWILENTNTDDNVYLLGTFSLSKKKWIRVLSLRQMDFEANEEWQTPKRAAEYNYVIYDYSDAPIWQAYGRIDQLQSLQNSEKSIEDSSTLVYSKNLIQVYLHAR